VTTRELNAGVNAVMRALCPEGVQIGLAGSEGWEQEDRSLERSFQALTSRSYDVLQVLWSVEGGLFVPLHWLDPAVNNAERIRCERFARERGVTPFAYWFACFVPVFVNFWQGQAK